jgi:polyisoprenoid-binding protein YceI
MQRVCLRIIVLLLVLSTVYAGTPREYKIDTNHSTVGFSVPILGGLSKVTGKFTDFNIALMNDEADITKSTVKAIIKTASIDTGIADRDAHLKTADFFDTEKFPEITFESTQIKKSGKNFIAIGNLTMHGVTKRIELPFTITGVNRNEEKKFKNIGYSAKLIINRRDYGINWTHSSTPNFVGDNVEIELNLITRVIKDEPAS